MPDVVQYREKNGNHQSQTGIGEEGQNSPSIEGPEETVWNKSDHGEESQEKRLFPPPGVPGSAQEYPDRKDEQEKMICRGVGQDKKCRDGYQRKLQPFRA